MSSPNMLTITQSLERSLQNCTLNHNQSAATVDPGSPKKITDSPLVAAVVPTLELNSEAALPLHWEQCLDLKTGEIYYINWTTGMKAKDDPRTAFVYEYSSDDEEEEEEEDCSSYDSEDSSSESSLSSSREHRIANNPIEEKVHGESESNINSLNVLVVAGCKSCLMYYMVPKKHGICPKCGGELLHFDRSLNGSS